LTTTPKGDILIGHTPFGVCGCLEVALIGSRGNLYFFVLAKYSRTIIRINPLTEFPFSSAIFRNCSITSGEKKTFVLSLLAFGLGDTPSPPYSVYNITILSSCQHLK